MFLAGRLSTAVQASDPADVQICEALVTAGRPGLFLVSPNATPQKVNGSKLTYDRNGRFYFVPASINGRTFHARREMIWNVRLQTTAKSAKADETIAWRPPIKTECSGEFALESFDLNSRFVSLQRYYDHHAGSAERRRIDPDLRRKFHLAFSKSAGRPCQARTDAAEDVGDLRKTYDFEDVEPDAVLLARLTSVTPAVAATSQIYSGLASELAHIGPGEPACFGFAAPLPTRSTWLTQVFPFSRNSEAQNQAQSWTPDRTVILFQRIPGQSVTRTDVRWQTGGTDGAR
jgi:hypothetical protein